MIVAAGVELVTRETEGEFRYETMVKFDKSVSDETVVYYVNRISSNSVLVEMREGIDYSRKGLSIVLFKDHPSCVAYVLGFS
jgi:hypothetical protein